VTKPDYRRPPSPGRKPSGPKAETYEQKRAAEKRGVCVQCGTSDAACTRRVLRKGKACCGTCGYTDTHPKPNKPLDAAPCSHCGGSGVEPADDAEGFYDD
jgi:hypothetical protein